jgi:choline dehydrogenase-like flavoprotein
MTPTGASSGQGGDASSAASQAGAGSPASQLVDPGVARTHAALFDNYLPIDEVPPEIRSLVVARARRVSDELLAAIAANPQLLELVTLLAEPEKAMPQPLLDYLRGLRERVVDAFLQVGFGSLEPNDRDPLWDVFIARAPAELMQIAARVRLLYLSTIWDLPIAGPITGIQTPQVFIDNLDAWVATHTPDIPPSLLRYDESSRTIACVDGKPIDYLVVGSGPGGATVAAGLQSAGFRVVLVEKGPFVVWGSMDTRSYASLMYQDNAATSKDGAIIIRSGQTVGGASTVNIDLAFSPLEATVQTRLQAWIDEGRLDPDLYGIEAIRQSYDWVRSAIGTRELSESELNRDNLVLWNGAKAFGIDPSLYHLNRFAEGRSPSAVDDKRDAARELLLPAIQDPDNPLSIIPDASVEEILFEDDSGATASGVRLTTLTPWTAYANTVVDPCGLKIPPGTSVSVAARNIVVSAGTIGSSRLLLRTARANPEILDATPQTTIGRGLVLHPSVPIIGLFEDEIDLLEGLDSATHVDAFGPTPGFIFETMSGLPGYGAAIVPGSGRQVFEVLSKFQHSAGFGLMRIDSSASENRIVLDETGEDVEIQYTLTPEDIREMRHGLAIGIRMMFMAGAYEVVIPTNENVLDLPNFRPTDVVFLTKVEQADDVERNLNFIPNRTLLTSAHLQATNKMGPTPADSVVSTRQRVWRVDGKELPNLYVMDSSIFPTSVGANPMQAIYTLARIFTQRLTAVID